jgi:hypothetical protein
MSEWLNLVCMSTLLRLRGVEQEGGVVASARDLLGREPPGDEEAVLSVEPGRLVFVDFR